MKIRIKAALAAVVGLSLTFAHAQPGGRGGGMGGMGGGMGPQFSGALAKLFGDNSAFSGSIETTVKMAMNGQDMTITMPGKIAFDSGKSRVEMDLGLMKGAPMPPGAAEQMKAMGMDKMTMLSLPDKKLTYMIYPGLKSYAEVPMQDPDAAKPAGDFKSEKSELGKETLDGHPCVKNKVTVTDDKGSKHDYTVWNATDMKDFPVKVEFTDEGTAISMQFKDVKLAKPAAAAFEPPAGYEKYDNMMKMIQEQMMKRMGGPGAGGPDGAGGPPPGNK